MSNSCINRYVASRMELPDIHHNLQFHSCSISSSCLREQPSETWTHDEELLCESCEHMNGDGTVRKVTSCACVTPTLQAHSHTTPRKRTGRCSCVRYRRKYLTKLKVMWLWWASGTQDKKSEYTCFSVLRKFLVKLTSNWETVAYCSRVLPFSLSLVRSPQTGKS